LANLHLPHLPTRNEVLSRATAMFARTPSIDDIVDQAHIDSRRAALPGRCQGNGGHW
jgi:hypothetical protein